MEKNKVYITDYINLFLARKLLFSLITVICTIVMSLALYFGVSKPRTKYDVTFSYSNTTVNNNVDYKNLVSSYYLNAAKAKQEDFESIDVDNILNYNLISVSKNGSEDITYTLTLSAKAIRSESLTREYVQALLNLPIERLIEINSSNYQYNLEYIESSLTYEKKLDFMSEQYTVLNQVYQNIITNNLSGLKSSDYNNLINKYSNFTKTFLNVDFNTLKNEAITNGYVDNFSENKNSLLLSLNSQIEEYLTIKDKIDLINSSNTIVDSTYYTLLDSLYETKSSVKSLAIKFLANSYTVDNLITTTQINKVYTNEELNQMKDSINQEGFTQFKETISDLFNSLKSSTKDVNDIEKLVYSNITVQYNSTNVIEVSGNISLVLIVIISLILGIALACVVIVIIDHKKLYVTIKEE